ncbi:MAG TPA: phosphomannomutase/phosphoglucomutase, partial [Corynebacterium sp.]|nr:phosphomannomutase/phosphoglucomutase [Corynebacterium sp.]
MRSRESVSAVIKAYDIRGIVGEDIDAEFVREVGGSFARMLREEGEKTLAVGYDMRPSSPELAESFAAGVAAEGLDVIMLGLTSTDELYYASGTLNCAGAMFTASHNPAEYNGIKLCRSGARPVSQDSGLARVIDDLVAGPAPAYSGAPGSLSERDVLADYGAYLRELVDLSQIRPLVVAVDAANGMGGHTVP